MKTRLSFLSLIVFAFFIFSFGLCDKAVDSVVVTFDKNNLLFPSLPFTFGNAPAGTQTRSGSYTVTEIDNTIQTLTTKAGTKRTFKDILSCNLTSLTLTITKGDIDFSAIGQATCTAHVSGAKDIVLLNDDISGKYGAVKSISIPIPTGQVTDRILALQSGPTTGSVSYDLTVTTKVPVVNPVTVVAALGGSVEVK